METKLKFGLSQVNAHAPRWLVNITALLTLVITAKHHLVNGLPLLGDETKVIVTAWLDYILDTIQVLLAITVIFSGESKPQNDNDDIP